MIREIIMPIRMNNLKTYEAAIIKNGQFSGITSGNASQVLNVLGEEIEDAFLANEKTIITVKVEISVPTDEGKDA